MSPLIDVKVQTERVGQTVCPGAPIPLLVTWDFSVVTTRASLLRQAAWLRLLFSECRCTTADWLVSLMVCLHWQTTR